MTALLPELVAMPEGLQLDGEIVAIGDDGQPDFHLLSSRMLHGAKHVPVLYFAFDVLACEGGTTTHLPYGERRQLLEALEFNGPHWQTVPTFDDGAALFQVMCDRSLEGVVAKQAGEPYRSGERLWVKTKNKATVRFAQELAGVGRR
jgi:bifunctional non-homologous end joining protein LigD